MDFKVTNSFSRDNLNYENGVIKNIHYGDIHTKFQTLFDITKEIVPFINEEINISRISEENYCKEGDMIFADASEDLNDIGKSIEVKNLNNEKILSGLHTLLARPKQGIFHLGFNGYLFKSNSVRTQIQKEAQGTKVLSISAGRISKIELAIPAIEEQKRIVSLLISIDYRITAQSKTIEELNSLKATLANRIFSQELRFKDENGIDFPDWKKRKLGEILQSLSTKKYQIKTSEIIQNGNFAVIDQGQGLIAGYSNEKDKLFNEVPVIIFGDHTTIIKYVDFPFIVGADGTKLLKTTTNDDLLYLYYNLQFNNVEQEGYKRHFTMLSEIYLQIPCLYEQQKIANFLSSIDTKIDIETQLLVKLEEQKKFLLQNIFV